MHCLPSLDRLHSGGEVDHDREQGERMSGPSTKDQFEDSAH